MMTQLAIVFSVAFLAVFAFPQKDPWNDQVADSPSGIDVHLALQDKQMAMDESRSEGNHCDINSTALL